MGLYDINIVKNSYLCQPEFIRWRRKHRKARINKKWRKKYGAVVACKGKSYSVAGTVVCCPCAYQALRKALAEAPDSGIVGIPSSSMLV